MSAIVEITTLHQVALALPAVQWLEAGTQVRGLEEVYLVESQLGQGGFSTTWAANRQSDGGRVVLKVLRLDRAGELKNLELFEREAKVLASLTHPRIPTTHEFFAWDGEAAYAPYEVPARQDLAPPLRWIMVQSRVEGRSLRQRIEAKSRLRASQIHGLLQEMLELLEYLHGLNPPVVHRDIKPANIILDEQGHVHLVDFGAIADRVRRASTVGSTSVGTFGYLPMEQMMGQARPASDLYALGITTVVVATHREPEDLPIDDATAKIELASMTLGLSPATLATLDKMIEPIVGQRVQSATAALALLRGEAVPGAGLAVPGVSSPVAAAGVQAAVSFGKPQRPYAWMWKVSAGGGGIAAGLIYLAFFDSLSETALIQVSTLWVAPVAFGLAGHLAEINERPKPVASALLWSGLTVVALIFFIFGIFPSL